VKLVHKSPQLDLVGWYTLMDKYGPTPEHLPIHQQILDANDSAVLVGFHLDQILNPAPGNPLPLTIYESNQEAEDASKNAAVEGEDSEMKDPDVAATMALRFRELPYTTETGEAEMIAMQFIREGVAKVSVETSHTVAAKKGKGKATSASEESAQAVSEDANLTREELERIAALQTKGNALKMMRDRIALLIAYLETHSAKHGQAASDKTGQPSNSILRQIQALVTNVELVTPARQESLQKELLSESNDVKLIGLVTDMLDSLNEMRNVGKKFAVVEQAKTQRIRQDPKNHGYSDSASGPGMLGVGDLAL
jgi:COP9 signalosome complex subunit 6